MNVIFIIKWIKQILIIQYWDILHYTLYLIPHYTALVSCHICTAVCLTCFHTIYGILMHFMASYLPNRFSYYASRSRRYVYNYELRSPRLHCAPRTIYIYLRTNVHMHIKWACVRECLDNLAMWLIAPRPRRGKGAASVLKRKKWTASK